MVHILFYLCSFLAIWFGAGLIVTGVDRFSSQLKVSSFAVSFFVLGMLTSIPELSLGLNAILLDDPEIYVGNLLGGVIVIFLFVIPVLAIIGKGIIITKQLTQKNIIFSIITIAAPGVLLLDKKITNIDGVVMILLYVLLLFFIQKRKGLIDAVGNISSTYRINYIDSIIRIVIGVVIVYFTSQFMVERTIYFSQIFQVSPFLISLLGLSLGTNMPELSLAIRSVLLGKRDIALGDYMGSAAVNTLLFGAFNIFNRAPIVINGNFYITFLFIVVSLALFYLFSRSKNNISRNEGIVLLSLYVVFLITELL